jgi:asparagine synthase (glutamine-hydrolysing)
MPKRHPHSLKKKDSIEVLDELLYNAVKSRLIADVPVGCFLSGGVDSSLITSYASRQKKHLHTFSLSFPGYESYDESKYSDFVANQLKTQHTQISCTVESVVSVIDKIGSLIDEPIVDPAFIPTLILAKEARKTVKVVLTGDGADELFAGYSRYADETKRESIHALITTSKLTKILWKRIFKSSHTRIVLPLHERYSPQHIWETADLKLLENKHSFFTQSERKNESNFDTPLSYLLATDYRGYLVDQLLNKVDKATMSVNLESRAPYLDSEILNFANNFRK